MESGSHLKKEAGELNTTKWEDVEIRLLYKKADNTMMIEYTKDGAPVFRSTHRPKDLRYICYKILESIDRIEMR